MQPTIFFALFLSCIGHQTCRAQTRPPAPTLNHAAICVRDLKTSTNSYKSVLGLEEIPNPFNDGIHT